MNLLLLLAALQVDTSQVRISATPQPVWIEEKASSRALNFDILVENPMSAPLDVDEIQLSVYDSRGQLVLRRFIDGNGTRPSIRTVDAEIPATGTALRLPRAETGYGRARMGDHGLRGPPFGEVALRRMAVTER